MSKYNKELYAQLKEQGLCVNCRKPTSGSSRCFDCNEKARLVNAKNKPYKALRERRKAQGLCVDCGQPSETNRCESCKAKRRENEKKTRELSRELGICPRCNKNKLFGSEKNCPECRAKAETDRENWEKRNTEIAIERRRAYNRKSYYKSKAEHRCACCGRKTYDDKVYCPVCAERKNKARLHDIPRVERLSMGVCYICGKPFAPGYKMCQEHLDLYRSLCVENNAKMKVEKKGWFKYDVLPRNVAIRNR